MIINDMKMIFESANNETIEDNLKWKYQERKNAVVA